MADITIIGTGNKARGLATRALAGGKTVQLLAHEDKAEADALAAELGGQVTGGVVGNQLSGAIVIPAVYYDPAKDVVAKYGSALDVKVYVDITNPVDTTTYNPRRR
ncbi:UNVERIFIED_ORG: putative dinucleotide-binding enzyme [Arthrobacter globiformis]|nr:putative dinucleotide-binding enzyme [Arthrobacter globiformis]